MLKAAWSDFWGITGSKIGSLQINFHLFTPAESVSFLKIEIL